jgi:hypothetical protein
MPSLALLFELAERARFCMVLMVRRSSEKSQNFVSLENAKRLAAAWCEYLESHAYRRVYSCVVRPHTPRRAGTGIGKIRSRKVGGEWLLLLPREVYLKGWSGLDIHRRP